MSRSAITWMTLLLTPVSPMTLGEPWTTLTFSLLGSSTDTSPYPAMVNTKKVDRIMEERGYRYRDFVTLNK
ncbi:hypothetical protein EDD16DRAFT_1599191 [Pisolithus croceorrhizus]|nr:hypothetical protein EDD16DRAFT_1599191 [Pisolithus croceorrhizus]